MLIRRAAIFFCGVLLAIRAMGADAEKPQSTAHDLLHQLDDAFEGVFEKVAPAVVVVKAGKKPGADDQDQGFEFYFHSPDSEEGHHPPGAGEQPILSEGSGFIVRADGYIYTNYHVVEDAETIEVLLRDKRRFTAKVVGTDDRTDIAVLKIEATNLPTVTMADSDSVRVGQLCFAIGIPYNLDYSFSGGYVSAKGRSNLTSTPTKPMYEDYIQTDAFINPGNSGGPLFDIDGGIIGMNTLINGIGRGLAFAIPSDMLHDVGEELIATGKITRPWLGVRILNLADNPALSQHFGGLTAGVYVDTIEAEAPAYKSDLRPYDVITKVDGLPVDSAPDLQRQILKKKVGQTVSLAVLREGKIITIPVRTGKLPDDFSKTAASTYDARDPRIGLDLKNSGPDAQAAKKVTVAFVLPGGPADKAGVQQGDVITAVDANPVKDAGDCILLIEGRPGGKRVSLVIERNGVKTRAVLNAGNGSAGSPHGQRNPKP